MLKQLDCADSGSELVLLANKCLCFSGCLETGLLQESENAGSLPHAHSLYGGHAKTVMAFTYRMGECSI